MTGDEVQAAARTLVDRTTAAQGLPRLVDDQATLRRIAALTTGEIQTAGPKVAAA